MTTLRPWLVAASLLCGLPVAAATRIVDASNPCPGTGSAADPFCSIQPAFDAANQSGDTILVKPGTYTECLNAGPKAIVLQAENPNPALTVLDGFACQGFSILTIGNGSTVSGFTMTGGSEGAIFAVNTVTIDHNVITNNNAQGAGGGIYVETDPSLVAGPATIAIVIENNTIQINTTAEEGGGIFVGATAAGTVDVTARVENNLLKDNASSGVGGGVAVLSHAGPGSSTSVFISHNTVQQNSVDSPPNSDQDGFGGGIWVQTSGPGDETFTIDHNVVGPDLGVNDDSLQNTAVRNGGGISAWVFASDTSNHTLFVESNRVRRNTADVDAGGIEILVVADSLATSGTPLGRYSVLLSDNDIDGNSADVFGGGFVADIESFNTPSHRNPTDLVGNRITNNVAGLGGGGGDVRSFALGGPVTFCQVSLRQNTVTGNSAPNPDPNTLGFGGGLTLYTEAEGAGIARIDASANTVTGNDAYVGGAGFDLEGVTTHLPSGDGTTLIEISKSQIENNICTPGSLESCGWGIGYPDHSADPFPGVFRLTLRSSDVTPNEGGAVEATLANNRTDVCMPAPTATDRAFPGIDADNDVDGVDLLRLATAFGSSPGAVHYNPLVDLDGDVDLQHVVDGNDLAILGASFGQTCP